MGVAYLLSIIASTLVALTLSPALCALLLINRRLPDEEPWIARQSHRLYRPALGFSIRYPKMILLAAAIAIAFVASILILPSLGRVFLPEFQERSLVIATSLYPVKSDPSFEAIAFRSGRAPGDSDVDRLDEVLSGVRSAIAVKIFGPDLQELRVIGKEVETAMKDIPGVVDLQLEPQVPVKQIQIQFDRTAAARYGLAVGDLAEIVETALNGKIVSQVVG